MGSSKFLTTQAKQIKFSRQVKIYYEKKLGISYLRGPSIILTPPPINQNLNELNLLNRLI